MRRRHNLQTLQTAKKMLIRNQRVKPRQGKADTRTLRTINPRQATIDTKRKRKLPETRAALSHQPLVPGTPLGSLLDKKLLRGFFESRLSGIDSSYPPPLFELDVPGLNVFIGVSGRNADFTVT